MNWDQGREVVLLGRRLCPRCGLVAVAGVLSSALARPAERERAEEALISFVVWARQDRWGGAAGACHGSVRA